MAYTIPFYQYTTSRFGETAGRTSPHRGHDVAPGGQDFPSWVNGVVVTAGYQSCLGNRVVVKNDNDGYFIGVSHLANIKVSVGQRVSVGTALGNIGNTGSCSAGRHAHITVSSSSQYPESGSVMNPVSYAGTGSPAGGGTTPIPSGYGYGLSSDAQLHAQRAMAHAGRYDGPHDGEFGPKSVSAMQQWLKDMGYLPSDYTVDGEPGPSYGAALQALARDKGGYTGPIDGAPGSLTSTGIINWSIAFISAGNNGTGTPAPGGIDWKAWQTFLVAYDYTGPIDGEPGINTYIALQKFLVNFGYTGPQDGEPGENTWAAFAKAVAAGYPKSSAPAPGAPTGIDWAKWQTFLVAYGYGGPADGDPGVNTYLALQTFLAQKFGYTGLIDGEPGQLTWDAMAKAVAAGYPTAPTTPTDPTTPPQPPIGKWPTTGAFGIDVATSQRNIDFNLAKADGTQFVIVKMGGLNVTPQYVAPYYEKQIDGARAAGLPVGHYYLIGQGQTPTQQAEYFVENLYKFDVKNDVLALDNERLDSNGTFWDQSQSEEFLKRVIELTGIDADRVWHYAGASDYRGHQPWDKLEALGIRFWWAAYGANNGTLDHEPSLQGSIQEADVHQFSSLTAIATFKLDGNWSKYPTTTLFETGTVVDPDPEPEPEPEPGPDPDVDETVKAILADLAAIITKYTK